MNIIYSYSNSHGSRFYRQNLRKTQSQACVSHLSLPAWAPKKPHPWSYHTFMSHCNWHLSRSVEPDTGDTTWLSTNQVSACSVQGQCCTSYITTWAVVQGQTIFSYSTTQGWSGKKGTIKSNEIIAY